MASLTKTVQTELIAITNVLAGSQSKSSTFTATTHLAATIYIDVSPEATNTPGTELRIETSQKDAGDDTWTVYDALITTTATVTTLAVDGTEAIGATTIEENTTSGLDRNQIIFFKNATLANSEWAQLVSVTTNTNFVILDGLTNEQTGSTWYNRGQRFVYPMDLTAIKRLRVVCNNNYGASAVIVNWRCAITTADSIS